MKKLMMLLSVFAFVAAIAGLPMLATAHDAPGVRRSVGGCASLPPGQHRACRDCLNRGGAWHYHPDSNTCHQNRRPRKRR